MSAAAGAPMRMRWTRARAVAAAATVALFVLIVAWHAQLAPPAQVPRAVAIVLHSLALWPALILLALRRPPALFLAALAGLVLFSHGVMEAWTSPAGRDLALAEAVLSAVVVVGASLDGLRARFARKRGV